MVGRERELAELLSLLETARRGRARCALVLGEPGMGKTLLVEELAVEARTAGMRVTIGWCREDAAKPYEPWLQVLGDLGIADPFPRDEDDQRAGRREALVATLADAVVARSRAQPVVLILEDLHWADVPSLQLLEAVVSGSREGAILLLATARTGPVDVSVAVATQLARLPPAVTRLELTGLDDRAVMELTGRVLERQPGLAAARRLRERTGGNPFFLREVLRLAAAQDGVDIPGGVVPAGVRDVLVRRLARLGTKTYELLTVAALAGEEINSALLAPVLQVTEDDVLDGLESALRARLVVAGGHSAEYRFAHALVRDVLRDCAGPRQRADWHRRIAEHLETAGAPAAVLAAHWGQATGPTARRQVAKHALAAARAAMARTGYEQAAGWYATALSAGTDDPPVARLELGQAQLFCGQLDVARQTFREVADAARASGRGTVFAEAVLGMGAGVAGFEVDVYDERQRHLLAEAARLLPDEPSALRAALLARLSFTLDDPAQVAERIEVAEQAVDMAARTGDPLVEVAALGAYCDAIAGPDHVEARLVAANRMLALAESAGDPLAVLFARRFRFMAFLERGDLARVDAEIAAYAAITDRIPLPLHAWYVPLWRGMRALMSGDVRRAYDFGLEVSAAAAETSSYNALLLSRTLRAAALRAQGRLAELIGEIERIWAPLLPAATSLSSLAAWRLASGDVEGGCAAARQVVDQGLDAIPRDSEWLETLWYLGEVALAIDDIELAKQVHARLTPYTHLWAVDGIGAVCLGPVASMVDRLASLFDASPPLTQPVAERTGLLRREGALWELEWRGRRVHLRDSKGLYDLAVLVARPGQAVHVLDLVGPPGDPTPRSARGDLGPVLDTAARAAYRERLREIEADLAEAESSADLGHVERLTSERDFLIAELSAALGLGGAGRRAGDPVERARKAVARRIDTALRLIERAHPQAAAHLRLAVSTGRFCLYRPDEPVRWQT